jgi:hypothetical protein
MLISMVCLQTQTNVTVIHVRMVRRVTMKSTPTTARVWRATSEPTVKLVSVTINMQCRQMIADFCLVAPLHNSGKEREHFTDLYVSVHDPRIVTELMPTLPATVTVVRLFLPLVLNNFTKIITWVF